MKTLQVKLPGRSYNIDIGLNILQTQLPNVVLKKNTDLVVVVTNETLHNLYPDHVSSILKIPEYVLLHVYYLMVNSTKI